MQNVKRNMLVLSRSCVSEHGQAIVEDQCASSIWRHNLCQLKHVSENKSYQLCLKVILPDDKQHYTIQCTIYSTLFVMEDKLVMPWELPRGRGDLCFWDIAAFSEKGEVSGSEDDLLRMHQAIKSVCIKKASSQSNRSNSGACALHDPVSSLYFGKHELVYFSGQMEGCSLLRILRPGVSSS